MVSQQTIISSLVSVVIPCYNHGHYLGKAIDSVLAQQNAHTEVVVVDDGSTDNTAQVAGSYGDRVRYVHKQNGGLSAARNTGIAHAKGEYIVFLDADDWLYPKAIETNLRYLQQNPEAAFVSGSHYRVYIEKNIIKPENQNLKADFYTSLLLYNYIGVPAAVMYRRWILNEFRFDEDLKSCEDYDLYLRIARNYPVLHHEEKIAAYRIHSSSMSSNTRRMIETAMIVLNRQKKEIRSDEEKRALEKGKDFFKSYYCWLLYERIKNEKVSKSIKHLLLLLQFKPRYIIRLLHFKALSIKKKNSKESIFIFK